MSPSKVLWLEVNVFEVLLDRATITSIALEIVILLIFNDHLHLSIIFIPYSKHECLPLKRLLRLEPELDRVIFDIPIHLECFTRIAILLCKPHLNPLIDARDPIKVVTRRHSPHCQGGCWVLLSEPQLHIETTSDSEGAWLQRERGERGRGGDIRCSVGLSGLAGEEVVEVGVGGAVWGSERMNTNDCWIVFEHLCSNDISIELVRKPEL